MSRRQYLVSVRAARIVAALLVAGVPLIGSAASVAQTSPPAASASGERPPCPSVGQQSAATSSKKADGSPAAPAQPAEANIILPSTGVPTAEQQGQSVRAGIDCQMAPDHPNATRPGDAARTMPQQSK